MFIMLYAEILNGKMRKVKKTEFEICEKVIGNFGHVQKRPLISPVRSMTRKEEDTETQSSVSLGGEKNLVNVNINFLDNFINSN